MSSWKTYLAVMVLYPFIGRVHTCEHCSNFGEYLGCFNNETCFEPDEQFEYPTSDSYSPDNCTRDCQELGFLFAGIHNRMECTCACNISCNEHSYPDVQCGVPCSGDNLRLFCGGKVHLSNINNCSSSKNDKLDDESETTNAPTVTIVLVVFFIGGLITTAIIGYVFIRRKKDLRRFRKLSSRFKGTSTRHTTSTYPNTTSDRTNDSSLAQNTLDVDLRPQLAVTEHVAAASGEMYTIPVKEDKGAEPAAGSTPSFNTQSLGRINTQKLGRNSREVESQKDIGQPNNNGQYAYAECTVHAGIFSRKTASICENHVDDDVMGEIMIANGLYRASVLNAGSS